MKSLKIIAILVGLFGAFVFFAARTDISPAGVTSAAAVQESVEVIATGLDNPRGLNFGPDGSLYVAEAGSGGAGPCAEGPQGPRCYGATGGVTRIDKKGNVERIISDLPSLGGEGTGFFASGPHDISFQGMGNGYVTIGFGGDPALRTEQFGDAGASFAQIARFHKNGKWELVFDAGELEANENPDEDLPDTNPYGIVAQAGRTVFTDAGGNTLIQLSANGRAAVLAVFPERLGTMNPGFPPPPAFPPAGTELPMDAVPTSVAVGPDGAYYVGQLTGFPFPIGGANVYRVPAGGGTPEVFEGGFTSIIDIAFGPDGSLYVLEIAENSVLAGFVFGDWEGALIRVAPDGTRTEIADGQLTAPGGIAIGKDGTLYVTNNSIFSGIGEVLRITL